MSNTALKSIERGEIAVSAQVSAMAETSPLFDPIAFQQAMTVANAMATATVTLPEEYRGKPGNCLAVVEQAMRWRMSPFAVAQKTHFVSGKIGYEAQLINAAIINSGAIVGTPHLEWAGSWEKILGKFVERESKTKKDDGGHPVKYRVPGWSLADEDGLSCTVRATLRGETEPRTLTLYMSQARTRNSTLWADDPRQQLAYLAVKRWARLYCPGVIMGVYSPDELAETAPGGERFMGDAEVVTGQAQSAQSDKPASKTAGFKERVVKKSDKAGAVVTVEQVLEAVQSANTAEELRDAAAKAALLTSDDEKARVAEAYRARVAEAKQKAVPADDRPVYAKIADQIQKAKEIDVLDVVADLIKEVPDETQRDELVQQYHARRAELTGR